MRCICNLFVVGLLIVEHYASQYRQEGAMVKFCNPKYVRDCYAITRRTKRGEPYRSNFTASTLHSWGNNVTIKVTTQPEGLYEVVLIKAKLCDALKVDWLLDFFRTYSNIGKTCPVEPGLYTISNVEFPPKNLPKGISKILNGRIQTTFYFHLTKTDEILIESSIKLYAK